MDLEQKRPQICFDLQETLASKLFFIHQTLHRVVKLGAARLGSALSFHFAKIVHYTLVHGVQLLVRADMYPYPLKKVTLLALGAGKLAVLCAIPTERLGFPAEVVVARESYALDDCAKATSTILRGLTDSSGPISRQSREALEC